MECNMTLKYFVNKARQKWEKNPEDCEKLSGLMIILSVKNYRK